MGRECWRDRGAKRMPVERAATGVSASCNLDGHRSSVRRADSRESTFSERERGVTATTESNDAGGRVESNTVAEVALPRDAERAQRRDPLLQREAVPSQAGHHHPAPPASPRPWHRTTPSSAYPRVVKYSYMALSRRNRRTIHTRTPPKRSIARTETFVSGTEQREIGQRRISCRVRAR